MEFHQIRYFLAVCDQGNITRAAHVCHVSQPALTKAIQKIEDDLGGALFVRGGRGVELTELGRVMRTHLAKIEETRAAAHKAARSVVGGEISELNVGVMCTIGPGVLGPVLAGFQRAHPGIELVLHDVLARRGYDLLLSGGLDCALIARHRPLPARFEAVPLFGEPVVLAMAADHRLRAQPGLVLADLETTPYLDRLHCEFRDAFLDIVAERGLSIDVALRSEREDWIQSAVAAGQGVSMMPLHSVISDGVATRGLDDLPLMRNVEVVTVKERQPVDGVETLIAALQDHAWPDSCPNAA